MAFDFNKIDTNDDKPFGDPLKEYDQLLYSKFHEITDIPERLEPIEKTTIQQMGYWQADKFFTINLLDNLKELDYTPFKDVLKIWGYIFSHLDQNGFVGRLKGMYVFCLDHAADLTKPIKLMNFNNEVARSIFENTPLIIFQHYHGPITAERDGATYELDQKHYKCINDAVVFKGLYKARHEGNGTYSIERIFDKYYFNDNAALAYTRSLQDPIIEVYIKNC